MASNSSSVIAPISSSSFNVRISSRLEEVAKVPKGTNFDDRTAEDIQEVENWINKYPRRIHGYKSAAEMFEEELQRIS